MKRQRPTVRKRLKALIHMGTMSAIQVKGDLQNYYVPVHRCGKLGEGKHTMLPGRRAVQNAVRNNRTAEAAHPPRLCGSSSGRKI